MPPIAPLDRRSFLAVTGSLGFASTLLPGALYSLASQAQETSPGSFKITSEIIDAAARLADVPVSAEQKKFMMEGLNQQRHGYEAIRKLNLPNSIAPAYAFNPLQSGETIDTVQKAARISASPPAIATLPSDLEALAFHSVRELAELIRTRKVSSVDLTRMYLARLNRLDAQLHCVITVTEERALAHAKEADIEIAAGKYRGPLHGIPWGAKDLLAVKGYPTTWGAGGFEKQSFDENATVVTRLDAAGAVLIAKLTLGALAMGDKWFGGRTRNPWNLKQGSSGSSAGSASAVSAGCVAFAIGSETLGSISSPSTRCGDTGLRPTFGFVPRTGAMALSWTMDKLGPICRAVEDCALVLTAIHGPDGQDLATRNAAFNWDADFDWKSLRVGYLKKEFDPGAPTAAYSPAGGEQTPEEKAKAEVHQRESMAAHARQDYDRQFDKAALEKLHSMGVKLIPVELPDLPYDAMTPLLTAEAAAAFDSLTISGRDNLLTEQGIEDWPNDFRIARFYPAVEYIQANRARTLAIRGVSKIFEQVDIVVAPSSGEQLVVTNLTGHPALILPNGFRGSDAPPPPSSDTGDDDNIGGPGTPVSLTFLAGHYQDARLCGFARAYQQATSFHTSHPKL